MVKIKAALEAVTGGPLARAERRAAELRERFNAATDEKARAEAAIAEARGALREALDGGADPEEHEAAIVTKETKARRLSERISALSRLLAEAEAERAGLVREKEHREARERYTAAVERLREAQAKVTPALLATGNALQEMAEKGSAAEAAAAELRPFEGEDSVIVPPFWSVGHAGMTAEQAARETGLLGGWCDDVRVPYPKTGERFKV